MGTIRKDALERYLTSVFERPATLLQISPLGEAASGDSIKTYGYGKPVRVDFRLEGGQERSAVLHTASPSPFGHEYMPDRAQALLWSHQAFNELPAHVRSIDVGGFDAAGELTSVRDIVEFCQLTEYVEGTSYHRDFERIRDTDASTPLDAARADALCDYLVKIHRTPGPQPSSLYTRRIRELVGHGECIMGLADSYPAGGPVPASVLEEIEHLAVAWRWKLKPLTHRLRQVHGDFHPWNILFGEGADFRVLDRSRGEWGDPADDVACITSNFLFFALQRHGRFMGPLQELFQRFWERYLAQSGDTEMLRVVAPFFAFRGLVMASPVWYPKLAAPVRQKLIDFVLAVLAEDRFDPQEVDHYCAGPRPKLRRVGDRTPGIG